MKILRITSSGFEEGGAEKGIAAIQPVLEKRGHVVKILASDLRPDLPHFNHYTFKAPHGFFAKLMHTYNVSASRALKKALREFQPDVVHLHTLGFASPSILFALRNYKTVATVHGPEPYTKELLIWCLPKSDFSHGEYELADLTPVGKLRYFYYRYINYPLYIFGLKNVDRFITISTYISNLMESQGIASTYIPNGIRMMPYKPLQAGNMPPVIAFAGRLEKFKGVEYVLQALPAIVARFPDTIFYIAGNGRDQTELELLARTLAVEKHAIFLGQISNKGVEELYEKASVVVVPSIWPEVCSRSGIEAMSVGRPVVGSNVGGSPDWLIDGETGFLVPPKDPESIASAILKLFNDQALCAQMGQSARAKAETYAVELHAERIEKVYAELVSAGAANTVAKESLSF